MQLLKNTHFIEKSGILQIPRAIFDAINILEVLT